MSDIIHLNVGGTFYTTTKETLTNYRSSSLYNMFKDFPDVPRCPKDKDGNYFIDADGPLFRFILNYLRTVHPMSSSGAINLPTDFHEKKQLEAEAEFYGMSQMKMEIQQNKDHTQQNYVSIRPNLQEAMSKYNP